MLFTYHKSLGQKDLFCGWDLQEAGYWLIQILVTGVFPFKLWAGGSALCLSASLSKCISQSCVCWYSSHTIRHGITGAFQTFCSVMSTNIPLTTVTYVVRSDVRSKEIFMLLLLHMHYLIILLWPYQTAIPFYKWRNITQW